LNGKFGVFAFIDFFPSQWLALQEHALAKSSLQRSLLVKTGTSNSFP
jgi:hypothetical protein